MSAKQLLVLLVMFFVSGGVLAGGGKVRGDEGQGGVVQVQVFPEEAPGVHPWFVNEDEEESSDDETSDDEFEELGESLF